MLMYNVVCRAIGYVQFKVNVSINDKFLKGTEISKNMRSP